MLSALPMLRIRGRQDRPGDREVHSTAGGAAPVSEVVAAGSRSLMLRGLGEILLMMVTLCTETLGIMVA